MGKDKKKDKKKSKSNESLDKSKKKDKDKKKDKKKDKDTDKETDAEEKEIVPDNETPNLESAPTSSLTLADDAGKNKNKKGKKSKNKSPKSEPSSAEIDLGDTLQSGAESIPQTPNTDTSGELLPDKTESGISDLGGDDDKSEAVSKKSSKTSKKGKDKDKTKSKDKDDKKSKDKDKKKSKDKDKSKGDTSDENTDGASKTGATSSRQDKNSKDELNPCADDEGSSPSRKFTVTKVKGEQRGKGSSCELLKDDYQVDILSGRLPNLDEILQDCPITSADGVVHIRSKRNYQKLLECFPGQQQASKQAVS